MSGQANKRHKKQEKLIAAYYNYIGEHHLDNLCNETDIRKNEIESMNIPESMDTWFIEYIGNIKKKEQRKNIIKNLKKASSVAAVVLFLLLASLTIVTFSVEAIRVKVYNLLFVENDKYSSIKIIEEAEVTESNIIALWQNYYYPSYIPEDFKIENINEFKKIKIVDFSNKKNEHIIFAQAPNGTSFQLDTEGSVKDKIMVNSTEGILIEKEGRNILFWNNDECGFYIASSIELKKILNIAESIKKR